MGESEQLRAFAKLSRHLIAPQPAFPVNVDDGDLGADLGCELLPRDEIGVVLEDRRHDPVAALQVVAAPGVRDEVHALGRVADEDHLALARRVDEPGHLGARFLERGRGALAELVHAPVDVRVVLLEYPAHRLDDLSRFLARRGVVEVDQWLTPHGLGEHREIGADARHVQGRGGSAHGDGHLASPLVQGFAHEVVALLLELRRQLAASGADDLPVDEHMHKVRMHVPEDPLVVRD